VKVCTQPRPGPAAARNTGAACATGEILAFLDSDCLPTSGWIAEGVDELLTVADGTAVVAGEIEHRFATPGRRSVAEAYDSVTFLQQKRYVEENQACVTANLFVSREHFWRLGGFDESFEEASGEDWEWAGRARAAGTTIRYSPAAKVLHPALRTVADLRKKLRRVARGNALQWSRLAASGEADPAELAAVGPPDLGKLGRRIRRLWREERLSRAERWKAAVVLVGTWPSLRREWRRAAAKAQRKAHV
jgi:GT2 family glycosyltransferase